MHFTVEYMHLMNLRGINNGLNFYESILIDVNQRPIIQLLCDQKATNIDGKPTKMCQKSSIKTAKVKKDN